MPPKFTKPNIKTFKNSEIFELSPTTQNINPRYKTVRIEFDCITQRLSNSTLIAKQKWPKYNGDGLYYTPSFILPQDVGMLHLLQNKLKDQHNKKILKQTQIQTKTQIESVQVQIIIQQNYCGVCKIYYGDFEEHIKSTIHKQKSLKSPFTHHIQDFCIQHFPKINTNSQEKINPQIIIPHGTVRKSIQQPLFNCKQFQSLSTSFQLEITPPIKKRRIL